MKKLLGLLLILLFSLSLLGCSSVKDTVYTTANKDKVVADISKSNLTKEEKELFAKALDDTTGKYEGKTVNDIINDQKKIIEERKRLEKEMKNMLVVSFGNKGQIYKDTSRWIFSNYVTFDMVVTNNSQKDILAFKGFTNVDDIFGDKLKKIGYRDDEGIKAGETKTIPLQYECNEFMKEDMKFFDTSFDKLKITWETTAIVFADGTKIGEVK